MSHPILIAGQGNARYQAMLQEAETERRYQQSKQGVSGQKPGLGLSAIWSGNQFLVKKVKPVLQK